MEQKTQISSTPVLEEVALQAGIAQWAQRTLSQPFIQVKIVTAQEIDVVEASWACKCGKAASI